MESDMSDIKAELKEANRRADEESAGNPPYERKVMLG